MKISFIIPTLNEVKNVPLVLELIRNSLVTAPRDYEIIFVDDKSTDGTIEAIQQQTILNPNIKLVISPSRKGLGHALKLGLTNSAGNFALFLDCDVSIRPEDLTKLLVNSDERKMLIGSRYINGGQTIGAPPLKVFLSKCLNWAISRYLSIPAIDISHSLRIFPIHALEFPINDTHPAFFWELSIIATQVGLDVCEVPITFRERIHGSSKNRTKTMIKSVILGIRTVLRLKELQK